MQAYVRPSTLQSMSCPLPSPCNLLVQVTLGLQRLQSSPAVAQPLPGTPWAPASLRQAVLRQRRCPL
jgi:hypothetical protein